MRGSAELIRAVTGGGGGCSNVNHHRTLSEDQRDGKEAWDVAYNSRLKVLVSDPKGTDKRLIIRSKITGAWLRVRDTKVSGT